MKQKIKSIVIFFLIFAMLCGTAVTPIYATEATEVFDDTEVTDDTGAVEDTEEEPKEIYGKLSAIYYGDGDEKRFRVMVTDGKLYVDAESLGSELGMYVGVHEKDVQLLLDDEWRGQRVASFRMNSTYAWYHDGVRMLEYKMPYKSIENEEGRWIPFRFAIKIMGSEVIRLDNTVYLSEFHESIENAVDRVAATYYESAELILGLGRVYDNYTEIEKQVALEELRNKDWVKNVEAVWNTKTAEGANYKELATYLVSNYCPEFIMDSRQYMELLNLYVAGPMMWNAAIIDGGSAESEIAALTEAVTAEDVAQAFMNAMASIEKANPEIVYNHAYNQIYKDTIGLDPITRTWNDEDVRMDEWIAELNAYSGIASHYTNQLYDSVTSILNVPDNVTNGLAVLLNELTVFKNMTAKNAYAVALFDAYLQTNYTTSAEEALYEELQKRVNNYIAYLVEYQNAFISDRFMFEDTFMGGLGEDLSDEIIGEILGDDVSTIWGQEKSVITFFADMRAAREADFTEYTGNYSAGKALSRGLRRDINETGSAELAYLYYKTDALALHFMDKALSSSEKNAIEIDMDRIILASDIEWLIEEETYHMSIIKMGIDYGLQEEENEAYNNAYNDEGFLPLVVEVDNVMSNTNGNMNAGGFASEIENYKLICRQPMAQPFQRKIINKNDGTEVGNGKGWFWWINMYEAEDDIYIYGITDDGEIIFKELDGEAELIRSGKNKKLIICNGYLYYQEDTTLYRREMSEGLVVGAEEVVLCDLGECLAYIGNDIYYSNTNTEICKFTKDGECIPLGIYSNSFDIMDNIIYYANLNDNNSIYAYYLMFEQSEKVGNVPNCYYLNVNGKQLYYKVDDDCSEGIVYALTPYANVVRVAVYACYYPNMDEEYTPPVRYGDSYGGRIFNIVDGKVYNEGTMQYIAEMPAYGFSWKNIIMYVIYSAMKIAAGA